MSFMQCVFESDVNFPKLYITFGKLQCPVMYVNSCVYLSEGDAGQKGDKGDKGIGVPGIPGEPGRQGTKP